MIKFFKKLGKAIFIFIMCGFVYNLVVINVIPNIKQRLHPETVYYHINMFINGSSIKNVVVERKPYFKDGVFYYYDEFGNLNSHLNLEVIVIEADAENPI